MRNLNRAKKVITIMLALAMVFALMPQLPGTDSTAYAVSNDDAVTVDGSVKLGGSGATSFYYDCATKTVCATVPESGSYAHFIPDYSGGSVNVLELCNYTGGYIVNETKNEHNLQINLIGENTITRESEKNGQGGILSGKDLTIFGANPGSKLTINVTCTSNEQSRYAVGIFMVQSDLRIGGYADVAVNVEAESQVLGIHCSRSNFVSSPEGNLTLMGNASLNIDCTVRFDQGISTTSCIYVQNMTVNTKGDLTANIHSLNTSDKGCTSIRVQSMSLDYVRRMTVQGTQRQLASNYHGSIDGFDSDPDGLIRFDEDVLAYNCTSDNVAIWRSNSGETPVTLTVLGGCIQETGNSTGRFFQSDKVHLTCYTEYLSAYEDAQFRRWYIIDNAEKKNPFYEGTTPTCEFYICDGNGSDCTVWADINVFSYAYSKINSGTSSQIAYASANSTSLRLYKSCLVKNGGDANCAEDVVLSAGNLASGYAFTSSELPDGIYQVASVLSSNLNTWYYSDPFAVFHSTFATQPSHNGDTGVLTYRLNMYLRAGAGAPKPQVDIVLYADKSTVVMEDVKNGDVITTLTPGTNYCLHFNVYGTDYYSEAFEAMTVSECVFASAPTVTPDESIPTTYANLSFSFQEDLVPYPLRIVNANTDEVVYSTYNTSVTTVRLTRDKVPEGNYRLEAQLLRDGAWYAYPSSFRVLYSPWGNPEDGSTIFYNMPFYDSLTGTLAYEPNLKAQAAFGSWSEQTLERLSDDGETWVQVGVGTNISAGFDMSGLPNGTYRLRAVYDDGVEPYEYFSQPFLAITHMFKSYSFASYDNETSLLVTGQLWEDVLDLISDHRDTTFFYLAKPEDPSCSQVTMGNASETGSVGYFLSVSDIRDKFNLDEDVSSVTCRFGLYTYDRIWFYSEEIQLDFRTPASFNHRYDSSSGAYRLSSAKTGVEYYKELYFDGSQDELTISCENKPSWLTVRLSDERTESGRNIIVLEGTPTESGSVSRFSITVSNVSGSDTNSFEIALNSALTLKPASGNSFVDTLQLYVDGIAEPNTTFYYSYSIGEDSYPQQPYVWGQYNGTIDPNWGTMLDDDFALVTQNMAVGDVLKVKAVAYSTDVGYVGGTAYAEYTKVSVPDAPVASRESGIFGSEFDLKLSCSTGGDVVILYTIDGSDPTDPDSTRYTYGTCDNNGLYIEELDEEGEVVRVYHHQYVEGKYVDNDGNPFPVGRDAETGDTITIKAVAYLGAWNESSTAYVLSNPSEVVTFTYTKGDGFKVSGTVTSFNSDTDNVTIQLIPKGYSEAAYEIVVNGNTADYSIPDVADGTYTMKVMKNNHVTREYEITVDDDVVQDVKIHLKGDINGDGAVTPSDNTKMLRHIKGTVILKEYEFDCADINGDGNITPSDNTKMLRHIKGTQLLW